MPYGGNYSAIAATFGAVETWSDLTDRTLNELRTVPEHYRPTDFWGPGLDQLLKDMQDRGIENFKRWSTARFWFYPIYGNGWTDASMKALLEHGRTLNPGANEPHFRSALSGGYESRRDFDVANAWWDQERWPFDLLAFGENAVGKPPQAYALSPEYPKVRFGRGYLNYLLCLAALSRHVDAAPRSFLEIGGGFGVLGEILMSRDPQTRYVDLDIPPLVTVASWYLNELFGKDAIEIYGPGMKMGQPISMKRSGVLPNYRIDDLDSEFEVFLNSFSFQEMEPDVVRNYIRAVSDKGVKYAVSLNSRAGKAGSNPPGGQQPRDPVTSDRIVQWFGEHGFRPLGRYSAPYQRSAGELVVLGR